MTYQAKDYSHLLGTPGFSDDLLQTHFKLYQGYVTHTNKNTDLLRGDLDAYAKAEVRRRLGWEFNGMRLHELYFGGMTNGGKELAGGGLKDAITRDFGSFDAWKADFTATGAARGIGWVALTYDAEAGRLLNTWINEHDVGFLAGTRPILLMDVFEHAFIKDYGTDKASYMKAYFDAVDWSVAAKRFESA